jgi:hypothetical protein
MYIRSFSFLYFLILKLDDGFMVKAKTCGIF